MKASIVDGYMEYHFKCNRCISISEIYDQLETVTKNQVFLRRNPDLAPFQPYTANGLAKTKERLAAKLEPLEEMGCTCEYQPSLFTPYSNTGIKSKKTGKSKA